MADPLTKTLRDLRDAYSHVDAPQQGIGLPAPSSLLEAGSAAIAGAGGSAGVLGVGARARRVVQADDELDFINRLEELVLRNPEFSKRYGITAAVRGKGVGEIAKKVFTARNLVKGGAAFIFATWLVQEIGQNLSLGVRSAVDSGDLETAQLLQGNLESYANAISFLEPVPILGASVSGVKALAAGNRQLAQTGRKSLAKTPEQAFEQGRASALGFQVGTEEGRQAREITEEPREAQRALEFELESRNLTVEDIERQTGLPRREFGTLKGREILRRAGLATPLSIAERQLTEATTRRRQAQARSEQAQVVQAAPGVRLEPALEKARQEGRLSPGFGIRLPDTPENRALLEKIRKGVGKP